ncbi:MAG: hypothetical protein BGO06_14725 [Shinella sp. 65-6]|nr:MAG: hypothetical protein BGO06_14725 [Shinella sp. 65-6]
MRDEDHGQLFPLPDAREQFLHLHAGQRVQGAERLVHQQQLRLVGKRAGDGDPLLHAAGKLRGIAVRKGLQAHQPELCHCKIADLGLRMPRRFQREFHVLPGRQPGQKRIALENHAAVRAGSEDVVSVDLEVAIVMGLQSGDDRKQRALAAAGCADQRNEFVLADRQRDVVENGNTVLGGAPGRKGLRQVADQKLFHQCFAS